MLIELCASNYVMSHGLVNVVNEIFVNYTKLFMWINFHKYLCWGPLVCNSWNKHKNKKLHMYEFFKNTWREMDTKRANKLWNTNRQ